MASKDVKRLFAEFQPEHYDLQLNPDREASKFSGVVTIRGRKVGKPSQRLTFHQKGLKVKEATVTKHDKKGDLQLEVDRVNTQDSFDEVRLHAKSMVYPGEYTVTMRFEGKITKPMSGMYPCFFELDGKPQQLIATQFESHHAREVFPCVDEPEAKATFDLTLTTPKNEEVFANTPEKSHKIEGDTKVTTFETTPKMSTYLLAFVFGNMKYKEAKSKDGTIIRAYATPDNIDFVDFALDTAVKTLEFYNDYFGTKYPLPKCDMVALPDFAAGAMENWGCITYREQCMLVDPANTSLGTKQYVAMVVAHELAHQWFGNLVTMRWWTDLWLNEGFASWIEYLAVDHLFPEWEMWTQFAVDEQQRAFRLDALEHTHPIEVPVHHPDEIRTIFDTISYSKGASVIHMLHQYLSPDLFRDGLRHYLKKHAYGNTDTVDLWESLEEVSGKPVKKFMHAWTSESGFPLLHIRGGGSEGVVLEQRRFYLNAEAYDPSAASKQTWPIPLLFNHQLPIDILDSQKVVLKKKQIPEWVDAQFNAEHVSPLDRVNASSDDYLLANDGSAGFYLTYYNSRVHQAQLEDAIRSGQMSPLNRLKLLYDYLQLAKSGQIGADTVRVLKLLDAYEREDNSAVWDVMAGTITSVRAVMDDDELRELMKPYVRRLVNTQLLRLGWEKKDGESHFDQLLRPLILSLASHAEEPAVVGEALRRFEDMKQPEDVEPDLRGVVYGTAVRHGDKQTFDKLFKMHEASTNSEERTTIAAALTGFKQKELIEKALKLIDSKSVRHQDVAYWVAYSFMNRHAKHMAWQWMVKHWDWLEKNLGADMSFNRFPIYAANSFSDKSFMPEYKKFFDDKRTPALERAINQGIEILTWQSAWKERDFDAVKSFFKEQQ